MVGTTENVRSRTLLPAFVTVITVSPFQPCLRLAICEHWSSHAFGTPRPNEYYTQERQNCQSYKTAIKKQQIDQFIGK